MAESNASRADFMIYCFSCSVDGVGFLFSKKRVTVKPVFGSVTSISESGSRYCSKYSKSSEFKIVLSPFWKM